MNPHAAPPLIVSTADYQRLEALLSSATGAASPVAGRLEQELLRAELREVGDIPPDVVTMDSELLCVDEASGTERRLRLVYPRDANPDSGRVSVLAPVGAALLGLSVGQSIDWPLPDGHSVRLRVTAITSQPELARNRPE